VGLITLWSDFMKTHYIVETSYGDQKLTKVDQYGDPIDPGVKQLSLDLNFKCQVIFKPNNELVFEIFGSTEEDAVGNAKIQVADLLKDFDDLTDNPGNSIEVSPFLRHKIAMLKCTDQIEFRIANE
tara:strand:+ start:3641 stop:4018 length:378 start_codon:yes stop_codon:yes gene_type:complete